MSELRNIESQVSWIDRKGLGFFMGNGDRCTEQMLERNGGDGYQRLGRSDRVGGVVLG